ncbi:MAG: ABC transporter permease, partial [Gemmatimonadaceae bacterium]
MDRAARRRVFRLSVGAKHVERDVDQELEFHVEMRTRKLIATGMAPDEARARAILQFGDMRAVRAECVDIDNRKERTVRRTNYLSDLRQDVLYALRAMRQNAGFTAVVLLTLALGIGANTSTFTLIDALLLRRLPVPHPEQLVTVGNPARTGGMSEGSPRFDIASYPQFTDVRDQAHTLSGIYASGRTDRLDVFVDKGQPEAEHPHGRFVSANYFSVLQIPTVAGRAFTPDEDLVPAGSPVVVISYAYWQARFAGVRSAVGRTISVNGVPLTIVGIAPATFASDIIGQRTDMWIPIMEQPALMPNSPVLTDRSVSWLLM